MLVKTNSLIPLLNVCNQINFWNQNLHQFSMSICQYVLFIVFFRIYFIIPIVNVLFSSRFFFSSSWWKPQTKGLQDFIFYCSRKKLSSTQFLFFSIKILLIGIHLYLAKLSRLPYPTFLYTEDIWLAWKDHFLIVEISILVTPMHIFLSSFLSHGLEYIIVLQFSKEKKKEGLSLNFSECFVCNVSQPQLPCVTADWEAHWSVIKALFSFWIILVIHYERPFHCEI